MARLQAQGSLSLGVVLQDHVVGVLQEVPLHQEIGVQVLEVGLEVWALCRLGRSEGGSHCR